MTQQLYLLRHAEAEPWSPLGNDFSRSLNSNGNDHAQLISDWMVTSLAPPDTILCSPAKRTRETLAPLLNQWPVLLATTDYEDSMYGAALNMLLTLADDAFSYSNRLLMVGHNPGCMAFLNALLAQPQEVNIQNMATGTLAVIEFPDGFKRDSRAGFLKYQVTKKDLSDH